MVAACLVLVEKGKIMKVRATIDHTGCFVLGYELACHVWVLCRTGSENPGPAYCESKQDAFELRSLLAARAESLGQDDNKRFLETLTVFQARKDICDSWSPDTPLWIACQPDDLEQVPEPRLPGRNELAQPVRRRNKSSTADGGTATTPPSDNISYASFGKKQKA